MKVEKFERITLDEELIETLNEILEDVATSQSKYGLDPLLLAQCFRHARKVTIIADRKEAGSHEELR